MADLPKHACKHGAFLLLARVADLAQAERPQRAAVALALADLAPYLGDLHFRHLRVVLLPAESAPLGLLFGYGLGCRFGRRLGLRGCGCGGLLLDDGHSLDLRFLRLRRCALLRLRRLFDNWCLDDDRRSSLSSGS